MNPNTQQALQHCTVCPRNCGADRLSGKVGFCGAGTLPKVALVSNGKNRPSAAQGVPVLSFSLTAICAVFFVKTTTSVRRISVRKYP